MMDTTIEAETVIEMENWDVVAVLGSGVYVTDGDKAFQIGGHYTDESTRKKLKREYAKLYNNHGEGE